MKKLALSLGILALASCSQFGGRIIEVGPNTYRITHTMGPSSPVKGVRQGVIDRATAKCSSQNKSYEKVREDMGMDRGLSYNLTFECK